MFKEFMRSVVFNLTRLLRRFETNREAQFWGLQLGGWAGLCVITFLSLTVWYGAPNWRHVSHTLIQAALGMALTLPLRLIYKRIWKRERFKQFVIIVICIVITGALWTALRMQAFLWLGEEYEIWKDFGGWYFGSFMVFSSWTALYYGVKFYQLFQNEKLEVSLAKQKMQDEQLKRLSAETGSREAQIKMLRYQLNPHFLFNTLNSISALVKTQRSDQARSMISQLSDFLRFSLDNDATQKVTLKSEVKTLRLYLDIEKVRYAERLKAEFSIAKDTKSALIPSLILQPLIENALKYAVAGRVKGGRIQITSRLDHNHDCEGAVLELTVSDDGPGVDPAYFAGAAAFVSEKGVGLKNVSDRLHSHYGERASLSFTCAELGGVCAVLRLPFETHQSQNKLAAFSPEQADAGCEVFVPSKQ